MLSSYYEEIPSNDGVLSSKDIDDIYKLRSEASNPHENDLNFLNTNTLDFTYPYNKIKSERLLTFCSS